MIGIADGLRMRRHHDDKRGDLILPQCPNGYDIDHLSEYIVVVDSLVLLFVSYSQERAVRAGVAAELLAGHSLFNMGSHLAYPFIIM